MGILIGRHQEVLSGYPVAHPAYGGRYPVVGGSRVRVKRIVPCEHRHLSVRRDYELAEERVPVLLVRVCPAYLPPAGHVLGNGHAVPALITDHARVVDP